MKTIEYTAEAIKIEGLPILVDGKPANFEWFARWILDSDARFNNDVSSLKAAAAIEKALDKAATSSQEPRQLIIDDVYYDKLKQAADNPSTGSYPLRRGRLCLPWIEMIENAT